MTVQEWLDTECLISELKYNSDGTAYIPIERVKNKLNNKEYIIKWEEPYYHSTIFNIGKYFFIKADGVIDIHFIDGSRKKVRGTTCFQLSLTGNVNYEATAIAEVEKNACKKLGKQFGSHLNQDLSSDDLCLDDMPPLINLEKPIADTIILKKLENARKKGDTKTIEEIENNYQICSQ